MQQVSDALRIRPDIIRALEMEDFARMPAKGFARNQVSAYARYLGLDSVEFTDRFLAAYNDFERSAANIGYVVDHQQPSGGDRAYAAARRARNQEAERQQHRGRSSSGNRNRPPRNSGSRREPQGQRRRRDDDRPSSRAQYASPRRGGRSARSGDRNIGSRGFNPAGSRIPVPKNRLIMIVAAIIILILIIFGISRCAGGSGDNKSGQSQSSQNAIQVTGGQENGTVMQDQDVNALTTMPDIKTALTQFETTVTIPTGSSSSLQVDVDGQNAAYDTFSGPYEQKFTSKNTITVVAWNPSAVTVTANGTKYEFKEASDGSSTVKLKLSEGKIVQE